MVYRGKRLTIVSTEKVGAILIMKMEKIMKNIFKALLLITGIFSFGVTFAAELTEEKVNKLIAKVDNAAVSLDAIELAKLLSDNVSITMNISMQGKMQVMKPTKQQYLSMLQQGWSMYKNYKYSKSNVKIKIEGNKALVTADVKESMTVQGQSISGESKEEITIELVSGKALITNVVGYTKM